MIPTVQRSMLVAAMIASFATMKAGGGAADHSAPVPAAHETPVQAHEPAAEIATEAPKHPATSPLDYSDEAAGLMKLGGTLGDRGDFPSAEIAFRQILTRPEFTAADKKNALLGIARTYRMQGLPTKSAAIYEKFLKEYADDPRTPEVLLELGRTQREMGAHKLAISRFYSVINSTLKIPREDFERYQQLARTAQFEIAQTHFELGNYVEAGKFYGRLRLLELAPVDRARAHFMSGRSLQLGGELDDAVQVFRAYLEQWPDSEQAPEAGYMLATTLRLLNRGDEALAATHELLRNANSRSSSNPKLWSYWQRRTGNQLANDFFQSGNINGALSLYKALAGLSDEPAWVLPVTYQIGLCQERLLDTQRAKSSYRTVVDGIEALGERASPELRETRRMAAWRLEHMDWQRETNLRLTEHFSPNTPEQKDDPDRSTAAAPRAD